MNVVMNLVKFFEKFDAKLDKRIDTSARTARLNSSVDSSTFSNTVFATAWSVLCFTGKEYPLLFFSRLLSGSSFFGANITSVNFDDLSLPMFLGQLQMSFLGQNSIYWCKNISALDTAQRKTFLSFVQAYQGPHKLIFFTSDTIDLSKHAEALTVALDENIDGSLYQFLYRQLYAQQEDAKAQPSLQSERTGFTRTLFASNKKLSLDHACLMMSYNAAVGDRDREVCGQWLERLITPDMSLFTLSQYFFAKDTVNFMKLWDSLEENFPVEFWISFWSEQLWQANIFVSALAEYGAVAARKRVNRLPFSFMQKDYQRSTLRELTVAHNFLYSVDYGSKNGHASFGLELFFLQFLQGQFARK
jgi:hypothetical protein